jgi:hypothetical protein
MNHKNPDLNIRYSVGLGDFIASTLHSKPLSWIVKSLTGNDKPCLSCSKRRQALNVLFPIKFWKIFFKDMETYLENLKNFYIECGFNASLSPDKRYVIISNTEQKHENTFPLEQNNQIIEKQSKEQKTNNELKDYIFLSSNEVTLGEHLIKTEYYKKI